MAKKCRQCKQPFDPMNSLQVACSPGCALELTREKQRKDRRKADRKRMQALRTPSDHVKLAQKAFNQFIRVRDEGQPCISCGATHDFTIRGGMRDCGHYRSTGAASHLRFNLLNAHAQCKRCNRDLSGNAVAYRMRLIEKIGLETVERLENDNTPRKFNDIEYLKRLTQAMNRRTRIYRKLRGTYK